MAPDGPRGRVGTQALQVVVGDARGRPGAAPGLARWLAAVAASDARGTVSVAVVSDARVRELNCRYRRRDAATDVLSFSYGRSEYPFLGDIVIARGVAR